MERVSEIMANTRSKRRAREAYNAMGTARNLCMEFVAAPSKERLEMAAEGLEVALARMRDAQEAFARGE